MKEVIYRSISQDLAFPCIFCRSDSTGKERDEETGYGYFGARYMDHELMTMWLSVDPMADKYPSISPYAYCAWNPVKLVDPDGRIIDSASVTQGIWDLVNPDHEKYDAGFALLFNRLSKDDDAVFSFKQTSPSHNGSVTCDGRNDKGQELISINYSPIYPTFVFGSAILGPESNNSLFEETFHAGQFLDGAFGFVQYTANGPWESFGIDVMDEVEAKMFAAKRSNNIGNLGIMKSMDSDNMGVFCSLLYPKLPQNSISAAGQLKIHNPQIQPFGSDGRCKKNNLIMRK